MTEKITEKKGTRDRNLSMALIKLNRDISVMSDDGQLPGIALARAMEISNAAAGCLFLSDEKGNLELKASSAPSDSNTLSSVKNIAHDVFTSGQYLITGSDADDILGLTNFNQSSILCVPVRFRIGIIGACYFEKDANDCRFGEQDADFLTAFMLQSANALEYQKVRIENQHSRQPVVTIPIREKIERAMCYIKENYFSDISREGLASSLDMHPDSLGRYFKMHTDKKIGEYINELRISSAANKLLKTDDNITDIAFSVGFESVATFNRAFLKEKNVTPTQYRRKMKKERIPSSDS